MKGQRKKANLKMIIFIIVIILLLQWIFIGYRYNYGIFKKLGDIRMGNLPGNAAEYSMENVTELENSPLQGKNVCFLGSSVTYGAASIREGIPEYFGKRFECTYTKEAVSGTTLVDNGKNSYVQRMLNNLDKQTDYDLMICQLSTNDATKELPLGVISDSKNPEEFDTSTITGAMEYIIAYTQNTWECPVVFYTNARYDSEQYGTMVKRLYELQEKWNIGILDLWSDDDFNTISEDERSLYMYDQIHPTKAGYRDWWCPELENQLIMYLDSCAF